jgi:transcriptional regulator with XRE-family HTH domain
MSRSYAFSKYPNAIRHYRRKRHFRLKDMAVLLQHRSAAHVAHWEKGRKLPSLPNLLKLSAILKCPVELLYGNRFNAIRGDILRLKQQHGIFERYD